MVRIPASKRLTVGLLFGGRSAEHEVSLRSAAAIHSNLDPKKYRVVSIYIDKQGRWRQVDSPRLSPTQLRRGTSASFLPWGPERGGPSGLRADIYFPILHGPYGEDGTIQGLFEMADVPYVGAGVTASAAGMDKRIMKTLFAAAGLPVVRHVVIREAEYRQDPRGAKARALARLPLPLFVKPANMGSSVGITKVKSAGALGRACDLAFSYDETLLIEEGIIGREFECSVLGHSRPKASLPAELIPGAKAEFYDYDDKYRRNQTTFHVPAPLPRRTTGEIRRLAVAAFECIGCSGMARVDFLLRRRTGRLFVNEINTIPGFTEISLYPRMWAVSGLSFPALLDELIRLGFERHRSRKRRVERSRP
jgi:D-alanine-D-alanine ligase